MIHPVHLLATYIHQLYVDAMLMFPVMCHVSLHFAIKMMPDGDDEWLWSTIIILFYIIIFVLYYFNKIDLYIYVLFYAITCCIYEARANGLCHQFVH